MAHLTKVQKRKNVSECRINSSKIGEMEQQNHLQLKKNKFVTC